MKSKIPQLIIMALQILLGVCSMLNCSHVTLPLPNLFVAIKTHYWDSMILEQHQVAIMWTYE